MNYKLKNDRQLSDAINRITYVVFLVVSVLAAAWLLMEKLFG